MYAPPATAFGTVNEKPSDDVTVTGALTVIATAARSVKLLPPIDCAVRELRSDAGAGTPDPSDDSNVKLAVAALLPAGSVSEPETPLLIPGNVTVVDELVENDADVEYDCGAEEPGKDDVAPPPPPPPPHAARDAARATPITGGNKSRGRLIIHPSAVVEAT